MNRTMPRDDVERLILQGDADDVRRALARLYDLALRETSVSYEDIANVVFDLVEDDE